MASVTLHVVPIEEDDSIGERTINLTYPIYRCIVGRSSKSGANKLTAAENNLRFDNRVVSRNHAEFYVDIKEKQIYLMDTCSMHGTSVNGIKLTSKPVLVSNDDIVTLGNTVNRGQGKHESFKPVKVRVGVSWENSSQVIASCETPATNTFAVPEDGDSDAEDEYNDNVDIENDPSVPWQDVSSNSGAGIISVRSSAEPADFETENTSSQESKDADDHKPLADYPNDSLAESLEFPTSVPAKEPLCFPTVGGNSNNMASSINAHGLATSFGFQNFPPQESTENFRTPTLENSHFRASFEVRPWFTSDNTGGDVAECPSSSPYPPLFGPDSSVREAIQQDFALMKKVIEPPVAQTHSHAVNSSTCSTKRKFNDSCGPEDQESQDFPDAQPQESPPPADAIKESVGEHPRKRAKTTETRQPSRTAVFARYAATAITGAVVGGVGAIIALASLPPNFFD